MTGLERFLRGWALVELRSAAPEHFLNRCCRDGIPFWEVTQADAFTLRLHVFCRDLQRLQEAAHRNDDEVIDILQEMVPSYHPNRRVCADHTVVAASGNTALLSKAELAQALNERKPTVKEE